MTREEINAKRRERYRTDAEYRERAKARSKRYYQSLSDEKRKLHLERLREFYAKYMFHKYGGRTRTEISAEQREMRKQIEKDRKLEERLRRMEIRRIKRTESQKKRYREDPEFRARMLAYSKAYSEMRKADPDLKMRQREYYRRRYAMKRYGIIINEKQ